MTTLKLDTILLDFESFLQSHSPKAQSFHPYFQEAVWEMVKNGGKRFRPALMFSVVEAFASTMIKNTFLPALAMEIVHTFSLIHDDLPSVDNAPLRRGHPTLHTKYNEVMAILSGDFLNSYAFYLISQARLDAKVKNNLVEVLALNACQMIVGEALDCFFENQILEFEKLQTIHTLKTAKLIASSLKMGGIIANLPIHKLQKLWDFGILLGVFFQIRDDYIDATYTQEEAGKPTQNDDAKNSYTNLIGIEQTQKELEKCKNELQTILKDFDEQLRINLLHLLKGYFHV